MYNNTSNTSTYIKLIESMPILTYILLYIVKFGFLSIYILFIERTFFYLHLFFFTQFRF